VHDSDDGLRLMLAYPLCCNIQVMEVQDVQLSNPQSPQSGTSANAAACRSDAPITTRARAAKHAKSNKDRSSRYRGVTKHRRSGRWAPQKGSPTTLPWTLSYHSPVVLTQTLFS
jgi:hypothetical protein